MLIAQMVDFTAVYVMLGVWAVGMIAGVLSIGASLFSVRSRFAKYAGVFGMLVGITLPAVVCLVTHNGYWDRPILYLFLALPALVGGVGAALTRVPMGRTLWAIRASIIGGSLVAASVLGHWYWQGVVAGREMMALLGGDTQVAIVDFRLENYRCQVFCDDRKVCEYLTAALCHSIPLGVTPPRSKPDWQRPEFGEGLGTFRFTFHFASGAAYRASTDVSRKVLSLMIPEANASEPGYDTHYVVFEPPIPARLTEICDFLARRDPDAIDLVLVVAEGEPTRVEKMP